MKHLIFAVNTAFLALAISACTPNPHRTIQTYDSNAVIIKIINHDEALRKINGGN